MIKRLGIGGKFYNAERKKYLKFQKYQKSLQIK